MKQLFHSANSSWDLKAHGGNQKTLKQEKSKQEELSQ